MVVSLDMGDAKDEKMIRISLHFSRELLDGIDLLRHDAGDLPSRAEVIRRLVKKALEDRATKLKQKPE